MMKNMRDAYGPLLAMLLLGLALPTGAARGQGKSGKSIQALQKRIASQIETHGGDKEGVYYRVEFLGKEMTFREYDAKTERAEGLPKYSKETRAATVPMDQVAKVEIKPQATVPFIEGITPPPGPPAFDIVVVAKGDLIKTTQRYKHGGVEKTAKINYRGLVMGFPKAKRSTVESIAKSLRLLISRLEQEQ